MLAGGQIASGTIYEFAYNELVNELTTSKYGLQVIEEDDMVVGVDYSTYWKVNQDQQYFIAPTKISYLPINSDTAPVVGNGMTLGLTDGTDGLTLSSSGQGITRLWMNNGIGKPVGTSTSGYYKGDSPYVGVVTDSAKSGLIADLSGAKSTTAKLYFKVANAVQNLELLDAGEVLEAVNGIATTVANTPHITETYVNGTSWYRVYSDRWCEQGGIINSVPGDSYTSATISLLKSYKNTNYSVLLTQWDNEQTLGIDAAINGQSVHSKRVNNFVIATYSWTYGRMWQACGYID